MIYYVLAFLALRVGFFSVLKGALWLSQRWSPVGQLLRQQTAGGVVSVGFFHPYCDAGGGGERVLWVAIQALLAAYGAQVRIVVYTGDAVTTTEAILTRALQRFNIHIDPKLVTLVFLRRRAWVEAHHYPYFTMLGQSLGSLVLGWEALSHFAPTILIDTMGYAFVLPLFSVFGRSQVSSYVHYPTISTDMLQRVVAGEVSFNNPTALTRNSLLRTAKVWYYRAFAVAYGLAGSFNTLVLVNSTWTQNHIGSLWAVCPRFIRPPPIITVYPPCDTTALQALSCFAERELLIVSVAQFRPEKDHALQLRALAALLHHHPHYRAASKLRVVLIGGCRNAGDEQRVQQLVALAAELGVQDFVSIVVNISHSELVTYLSKALIGLHTMRDEHFGIGVVEFQAAGVIAVAHNSAGPRFDIVVPDDNGCAAGFLATTADEYAACIHDILQMTPEARQKIREVAARGAQRFSSEGFTTAFLAAARQHLTRLPSVVKSIS